MHFEAGVFWVRRDFVCVCVCVFFFERKRPAASMYERCLIYLSTSKTRTLVVLFHLLSDNV